MNRKRKNQSDNDEGNDYDDDNNNEEENDANAELLINKFANDGSFLEIFKKMQEQQQQNNFCQNEKLDVNEKTKRKPKVLKVGIIQKPSGSSFNSNKQNGSNWNRYITEVRAYKEKYGDEDKNRPLVK